MPNLHRSESGDLVDERGVPIHVGDLMQSDHFRGARGKRYYLYHVITVRTDKDGDVLEMTPTGWLALTKRQRELSGGRCYLFTQADAAGVVRGARVVSGYGPGDVLDFDDRRKRRPPKSSE